MRPTGDARSVQQRFQAELEKRKREGQWGGAVRAHVEYQRDPIRWAVEKLDIPENTLRWELNPGYEGHRWDGTREPIVRMMENVARGQDTAVEAGTGTSKTFSSALSVLHFLACWENSFVITSAPREDQLTLNIWKELRKLWSRFERHFPTAELLDLEIRLRGDSVDKISWSAHGLVAKVGKEETTATRMHGFHGEHLLFVLEEMPGMHAAIVKAIRNTCTAPHNVILGLGNPDHQHDELHKFGALPQVDTIRISALDYPNLVSNDPGIIPGAVAWQSVNERREEYGEDHPLYRSRVRGISPLQSQHALIRWEWCEAAAKRYADDTLREGLPALGVDFANSSDGDKGAIARWLGACLTEVESRPCPDATDLAERAVKEAKDEGISPRHVGCDAAGLGGPVVNYMRKLGLRVRALHGSNRTVPMMDMDELWSEEVVDPLEEKRKPAGSRVVQAERFNNLRSQMWWLMREDLRKGTVALPTDKELFEDLTVVEFQDRNGIIVVESKESLVKRLGRSPDKGDAAVMGNFVRHRGPVTTRIQPQVGETTTRRDWELEKIILRQEKEKRRQAARFKRMLAGRR